MKSCSRLVKHRHHILQHHIEMFRENVSVEGPEVPNGSRMGLREAYFLGIKK